MVDAGDRHAAIAHRVGQAPSRDRSAISRTMIASARRSSLTDRVPCVGVGDVGEQKGESRRRRRRVGDVHLGAERAQQVHHRDLAAESVAVGVDVGGEADALPGNDECGDLGGRAALAAGSELDIR